jgi:general stress protein 26
MPDTYNPIAKLNELIKGIDFAMLTTIRANGSLHSCPMYTEAVNDDGTLWFFSNNYSEKVEAIKVDPRVNLAYSDPVAGRYVSVSGHAEPVRDHVRTKRLWSSRYDPWFAKGLEDPNLILLRVRIRSVEYWDESARRMVKLPGFTV